MFTLYLVCVEVSLISSPAGPIHSSCESGKGDASSQVKIVELPIALVEFGPRGLITSSPPVPHVRTALRKETLVVVHHVTHAVSDRLSHKEPKESDKKSS